MEFPRLVFKDGGPYSRQGGTYSYIVVENESEYKTAIDAGWYYDIPEAIAAIKKVLEVLKAEEEKPPTRAEMEEKARELKITFHPSLSDDKLLDRIQKTLKE